MRILEAHACCSHRARPGMHLPIVTPLMATLAILHTYKIIVRHHVRISPCIRRCSSAEVSVRIQATKLASISICTQAEGTTSTTYAGMTLPHSSENMSSQCVAVLLGKQCLSAPTTTSSRRRHCAHSRVQDLNDAVNNVDTYTACAASAVPGVWSFLRVTLSAPPGISY